eukprot:9250502-Pyramimonas_sp.AAC.1
MCGKAAGARPRVITAGRDHGEWNKRPHADKTVEFLPESQLLVHAKMSAEDFKEVSSEWAPKLAARIVAQHDPLRRQSRAMAMSVRIEQDLLADKRDNAQRTF